MSRFKCLAQLLKLSRKLQMCDPRSRIRRSTGRGTLVRGAVGEELFVGLHVGVHMVGIMNLPLMVRGSAEFDLCQIPRSAPSVARL